MLKEMVDSSAATMEDVNTQATSLCSQQSLRLQSGLDSIQTTTQSIHANQVRHLSQVAALADNNTTSLRSDMQQVSQQRAAADGMLESVTSTVGVKRKFLDSTVMELCEHVDTAMEQSITVVEETCHTAEVVLNKVSDASKTMEQTTSSAVSTFTQCMKEQGGVVSEALESHFTHLAAHTQQAGVQLDNMKQQASQHCDQLLQSATEVTGNTPRKVATCATLESPFKRTRNHTSIRNTVKQELKVAPVSSTATTTSEEVQSEQSMQEGDKQQQQQRDDNSTTTAASTSAMMITYGMASSELATNYFQPTTTTSDNDDDDELEEAEVDMTVKVKEESDIVFESSVKRMSHESVDSISSKHQRNTSTGSSHSDDSAIAATCALSLKNPESNSSSGNASPTENCNPNIVSQG